MFPESKKDNLVLSKENVLEIRPFHRVDQAQVKQLILSGLEEHWGEIDVNKNPDLNDIELSFSDGIFLLACINNVIVGTGALIPRGEREAEILRMSVARKFRRRGIAGRLLDTLVTLAAERGYQKVILETTATWQEVIAFYLNYGFEITHYKDGDVYFSLELNHNE